jgi:predicted transport protein
MRKKTNRVPRKVTVVPEAKRVSHKNVVGKLINFRGLVYAPVNENGVIFLFGKMAADLNMYVETIRPGYPDCVAKRYIGKGKWEELRIEFEFRSSDFERHKHHPADCDAIVCWSHDWKSCPKHIEVLELQSILPELDNPAIEEPDKLSKLSENNIDDLFASASVRQLYDALHGRIMKIGKDVWRKVARKSITYYSPERVFTYIDVQKQGLRFTVFTGGHKMQAVDPIDYERGGEKWGRFVVKKVSDFPHALRALKAARDRVAQAIKRGEKTGWFAERE